MKATNTCPKCDSTNIVKIPPFKGTSTSSVVQLTKWGTKYSWFDRYICTYCGYMEHYVDVHDKSFKSWLDEQIREGTLDSDFV